MMINRIWIFIFADQLLQDFPLIKHKDHSHQGILGQYVMYNRIPFLMSYHLWNRFLKHSRIRQVSDSEDDNADENLNASDEQTKTSQNDANGNDDGVEGTRRKVKYARHPMVLNNGSVIRVRREVSTSEEESSEDDEVSADQEPPHDPTPEPEPEPEPEDPLDVEERELNSQLQLSFTLTLVDEENIRQRLLEIKKSKLRKNQQNLGDSLVQKFVSDAEVTIFENQQSSAKQEEERILTEK